MLSRATRPGCVRRARSVWTATLGLSAMLLIAASAHAQELSPIDRLAYDVHYEWLQVGAGGAGRNVAPSGVLLVGRDITRGALAGWRADVGWLRAARHETNAKGLTAVVTRPFPMGRLTLSGGVATMIGRAESAVDSGGYAWLDANGLTGTELRPRAIQSATVGAGIVLGAAYRLAPGVDATASVRPWLFSGSAIASNRAPVLAGFGLSIRPDVATAALRGWNFRHSTPPALASAQETGR